MEMKDEELLAEEYATHFSLDLRKDRKATTLWRTAKQAFLAGLKAGKPQWHDLRENSNDLPKEEKQYLCCVLSWVGGEKVYACLIYDTQYHSWKESYGDVIKWCEIPTFDKE